MMNIPGGYHYSTSLRNELLRNVSYLTLFSDFVCLFDWRPARKKRRWHPINMDFASRPGLALVIIHTSRSRSSRLISTLGTEQTLFPPKQYVNTTDVQLSSAMRNLVHPAPTPGTNCIIDLRFRVDHLKAV